MEEIVSINLDNEMDLILAHKRTMKLGELCGLSLPAQTTFATAVSEIARSAISHGNQSRLVMSIDYLKGNKKNIAISLFDTVDLYKMNNEPFSYAKRLMGDISTSFKNGVFEARIDYRIPFSGTISPARIASFKHYFKTEPPLSPYDEIRKKNIQLLDLADKVKESENQYRLLTDTLPLMMFAINNMDEITFSNKWFNEFLGFQHQPAIKISWRKMLHMDDHSTVWPDWEKAIMNKAPFTGQGRLKYKDRYVWHLISMMPVKNEKDQLTGWIGFFVDIDAQKMVEQTLKENQELQRMQQQLLRNQEELQEINATLRRQNHFIETIIDASIDYITVIDRNENVITFNRSYERITGKNRQEVIGQSIHSIFPNLSSSVSYQDIRSALEGTPVHNTAYYSVISERYYEVFYVPLTDEADTVYGIVIMGHDITERIENEKNLKRINNELIKRNNELEQFAYVASHDLQEPLRKIKTYSSMLMKELSMSEKQQQHFDKIISSSDRMTMLIKDVLNYSRLSRIDELFEEADLNRILDHVKEDFELLIREKQATVTSTNLPVLRCVPLQISQLFANLISNSLKFSSVSPVIEISAGPATDEDLKLVKDIAGKSDYCYLTFKDNGIGFDQEFKDKVFTIFQRLHSKQTYSGTGIGLAICKRVTENHQGHISVSSEPGVGTTFRILLPHENVQVPASSRS